MQYIYSIVYILICLKCPKPEMLRGHNYDRLSSKERNMIEVIRMLRDKYKAKV